MRFFGFWPLGSALLFGVANLALAAPPQPPRTYSIVEVSPMTEVGLFNPNPADVTVYRDGTWEQVEVSVPPAAGTNGVRMRYLFDLAAHRAYTVDVGTRACSWMKYVSDEPPFNYDPIAAAPHMAAEMASHPPRVTGTETVNGLPARIAEFKGPDGKVESKAWVAEKGGFLLKSQVPGPGGRPITMLEVKKIDFGKRPDIALAPPTGCDHQTQGEWSSTGVTAHDETSIRVK